jgi:hypothetical protein
LNGLLCGAFPRTVASRVFAFEQVESSDGIGERNSFAVMIRIEEDRLQALANGSFGGLYPFRQLLQVKLQNCGLQQRLPFRIKQILCRAKLV